MLFDSHAHLQEYLEPDSADGYLKDLYDNRVKGVLTVSYDRRSSLRVAELSANAGESQKADGQSIRGAEVFRACGIHPEHAEEKFPEELISNETSFKKTFHAIGEIGLDYRDGMPPRELQQSRFEEQLALCRDLKLPAVIHSVRACDDTLRTMKRFKGLSFVMHGFSYSPEAAREFVKLGGNIGIGTRILDKRARRLPETVREIPVENLLLETDLPFCTQYSSDMLSATHAFILSDIADAVSSIKQIPADMISEITTDKALDLFHYDR